MPPILVGIGFFVAIAGSLALMVYVAWRGSQPSEFFTETVLSAYDLQLPEEDIDAYYDLKEKLYKQYAPEETEQAPTAGACDAGVPEDGAVQPVPWVHHAPLEERQLLQKALMKRLVGGIDRLDQVQRDKPGNFKLWRSKLVSERYWGSLCDAERMVTEEIDLCIAEANELEPGWRDVIFPQALQCWRMQKHKEIQKKAQKKEVEQQKKQKEKDERRQEVEKRLAVEEKVRQEKLAEKMMEKMIREEELAASSKSKAKSRPGAKPKAKGKK